MTARGEADTLAEGCRKLGITPVEGAIPRLSAYLDLLEKWNRAYNLTAVRGRDDMVVRHILDSLAVLPHLRGERFLDVGSGAGLPGIPLAICLPQTQFVLLDSNGKKARFLFQARHALPLENVEIVDARVEDYRPGRPFHGVLSRAFASLPDMVTLCAHLMQDGAVLYAMKGSASGAEIDALERSGRQLTVETLQVPGLHEQRSLVVIQTPRGAPSAVAAQI